MSWGTGAQTATALSCSGICENFESDVAMAIRILEFGDTGPAADPAAASRAASSAGNRPTAMIPAGGTHPWLRSEFRVEHDSMGDVRVPAKAYYGAQTQRAVENFPISGWPLPPELIHSLGPRQICRRDRQSRSRQADRRQTSPDAAASRCPAGRLPRSGRRKVRRSIPHRRFSDRLRHVEQHERQRGDQQSGHRTLPAATASHSKSRSIRTIT